MSSPAATRSISCRRCGDVNTHVIRRAKNTLGVQSPRDDKMHTLSVSVYGGGRPESSKKRTQFGKDGGAPGAGSQHHGAK